MELDEARVGRRLKGRFNGLDLLINGCFEIHN